MDYTRTLELGVSQFYGCTHCRLLEEATLISKNSLEQCWHPSLLQMPELAVGQAGTFKRQNMEPWARKHATQNLLILGWVLAYVGTPAPVHTWKSEDKLLESLISFHHVGAGDRTQISRLALKHLCPLSHLAGSLCRFLLWLAKRQWVPGKCPHFLAGNALFLPACYLQVYCRNAMKWFYVRGSWRDLGGSGEKGWLRCIIYLYERYLHKISKQ